MFKKIMAALSAFILAGCLYAAAEDLVIDGLGKLSFGEDVQITDGGGSRAETIFKKSGHRKDYGKTDWAAVMYFLTTPPGMDMYPDRAPYPYDSLHLYQIRKSDIRGTYSASVSVVKGTEEAFFHGKRETAARFWERAFHEDATRPHSLFGLPKISIEEYQRMLNSRLDEIKGQKPQAELVSFSPWHAYKNHDGTYRWTQEARVIISDERHLSYPMWIYTNLYRQGSMYYLIIVQGSHTAAEKIGKNLLYAFYGLERSGT